MATGSIGDLEDMFSDHPSVGSLQDFEHSEPERSPAFGIPSIPSVHSGFRSEEESDSEAEPSPWDPPAWRKPNSNWLNTRLPPPSEHSRSRYSSPQYESAGEGDVTLAADIPLPASRQTSPLKTPAFSPDPPGPDLTNDTDAGARLERETSPSANNCRSFQPIFTIETNRADYRMSIGAEVQHSTESVDALVNWVGTRINNATRSRNSLLWTGGIVAFIVIILRMLLQPPTTGPVPDLVKVAGLARSFEPLIYYSESGVQQIGDLQETGVAVWDLGESVRSTNMTSAPIIVGQLDELSDSLKTLAVELHRFFADVSGDVDQYAFALA